MRDSDHTPIADGASHDDFEAGISRFLLSAGPEMSRNESILNAPPPPLTGSPWDQFCISQHYAEQEAARGRITAMLEEARQHKPAVEEELDRRSRDLRTIIRQKERLGLSLNRALFDEARVRQATRVDRMRCMGDKLDQLIRRMEQAVGRARSWGMCGSFAPGAFCPRPIGNPPPIL